MQHALTPQDYESPAPAHEAETSSEPIILMVDDELNALLGLRRALRNHFRVKAIDCPAAALEFLASAENVAVVVSDLQMPYMDGLTFLQEAHALHPNASLVILTGNPTGDSAIEAINTIRIARYLTKPCTTIDLIQTLSSALNLHEQQQTFAQHSNALDDLLQAKHAMFSTVSHELRTPLHHISLCADLIDASEPNKDEVSDYLNHIRASCSQLDDMVTRILEYSRLRGMNSLDTQGHFSVEKLFDECRQHLDAAASEQDMTVSHASKLSSDWYFGDEELLRKAAVSLVSNAVKFCSAGDQISFGITRKPHQLRIQVADTGPGLQSRRFDDVQEPFFQEDGSYTREHGGLGLGLAFVREVARLHGGELRLRENARHGCGLIAELVIPLDEPGAFYIGSDVKAVLVN